MAVEARKHVAPRKYTDSCRNDRGDVTGVPSYASEEGGWDVPFLAGTAGGLLIIRVNGPS